MKKILITIAATILMLTILAAGALAAACVRFSGTTNVRSGPGLDCSIIGSVNAGSTLDYTGSTCYDNRGVAWYKIRLGRNSGWVSSRYASFTNHGGTASYASGGSGNTGVTRSGSYGAPSGGYVEATDGDTNVRSGPGLGYEILGVLDRGCGASFTGDIRYDNRGVAWYKIRLGRNSGWVSSRYTTLY